MNKCPDVYPELITHFAILISMSKTLLITALSQQKRFRDSVQNRKDLRHIVKTSHFQNSTD